MSSPYASNPCCVNVPKSEPDPRDLRFGHSRVIGPHVWSEGVPRSWIGHNSLARHHPQFTYKPCWSLLEATSTHTTNLVGQVSFLCIKLGTTYPPLRNPKPGCRYCDPSEVALWVGTPENGLLQTVSFFYAHRELITSDHVLIASSSPMDPMPHGGQLSLLTRFSESPG